MKESIDDIVTNACQAMVRLNRYRKSPACNKSTKKTICYLKIRLVAWLCGQGYCIEVTNSDPKSETCIYCDGSGTDIVWGNKCHKCNSGFYHPEHFSAVLVAFRFNVDGIAYGFHLPQKSVKFTYTVKCPNRERPLAEPDDDRYLKAGSYSVPQAIRILTQFLKYAEVDKAA